MTFCGFLSMVTDFKWVWSKSLARNNVGKLLTHVTTTKIHGQYAKAREVDRKYMEAARAYETAREYDSAIR